MPLLVEGCPIGQVPKSLEEFWDRFRCFKESAASFSKQTCEKVLPQAGLLYVGQREMAVTVPEDDKVHYLGSEDATTCHIIVLRHSGSGATCVSHFDSSGIQTAARKAIHLVKDLSKDKAPGRLELHLFGGFADDDKTSEEISMKTLRAFHDNSEEIHLMTACISDLNNVMKKNVPFPIVYGIAVDMKQGRIFPASFPDHGPEQPVRGARVFTGSEEVLNIYDHKKQELKIGPFNYSSMDEIDLLCQLPKEIIREHLSTSPAQEPPHFEDAVRASLIHMKQHPEPLRTVFKEGKPKRYEFSGGNWKKIAE